MPNCIKKSMKSHLLKFIVLLFFVNLSYSQAWMTNLKVAQSLASAQNKMVLMVWEETTKYPYPVFVNDKNDNTVFINNLFEDEIVSPLIWKHFVPVIVSDFKYGEMFYKIKGKRTQKYIDKFNDDSIKIMDVNGNILNVSNPLENYENITELIENYALNTKFINNELKGYRTDKNFYSTYYLASKYLDYAMYMNKKVRSKLIDLSTIYLEEASLLAETKASEDQLKLSQRVALLKIQQSLIKKRPKKVIRQLKRIDAESIDNSNETFVAFLYYTAYRILNDETNATLWESKISSVNLKKAQLIYNLNS